MSGLRVGVIGCGAFARDEHFPNCVRCKDVEITWACSRSEGKRKFAEEHFPVKRLTPKAEEVFKADDVDMVILSIPHEIHLEMVKQAAACGKHIFCEKPMAMNIKESYEIVRAVRKAGVKLCVDYNRRFAPSIQDMKKAYLEHKKNPVPPEWQFVDTIGRPPLPEEKTSMLMIHINDESSTYRPVHLDWKTGGGQIIGESCHWLDLARFIFEDEPARIYASGSQRLAHIITVDYRSGSRACIFFSTNGTFDYPKEEYFLTDSAACYINRCFVQTEYYGLGEPIVKKYDLQFDECEGVGKEGGLSGYIEKLRRRGRLYLESGKKKYPMLFPNKGHYELLEAFVDALLNDKPSPISEVDGARATYLSIRARESIKLGKALPINEEDYNFFVNT